MVSITARCTQCGHREHGDPSKNNNYVKYDGLDGEQLNHGTGRTHGTERLDCPTCEAETLHNRCAKNVPQPAN